MIDIMTTASDRVALARRSLRGLSVGDAFGQQFFSRRGIFCAIVGGMLAAGDIMPPDEWSEAAEALPR